MNIVYLCPREKKSCRKVKRIVDLFVTAEKNKVFHKLSEFEKYIRSSLLHQHVMILQAGDMQNLQKIADLKDLLFEHQIILILPDRDRQTVALGHSLRPRFITYQDSDFGEMSCVLCKMLQQEKNGLSARSKVLLTVEEERQRI